MPNPLPVRDVLERAIFGDADEAAAFEAQQAEALRVYGVHHGIDLNLFFARPDRVFGLDRLLDWTDAETLLFDVQTEADRDGGWRYVVYPDAVCFPTDFIRACDFGPQEAANVFAKAKVYWERRGMDAL